MPDNIPSLTEELDDKFLTTWYSIKPAAVDNILNATPIWALLNMAGCFERKVGGRLLTETIRYGKKSATAVQKGDTLPQGESETETMAVWKWKYLASHVQRSWQDDQQNQGEDAIKDYVSKRTMEARDGLEEEFEDGMFRAFNSDESGKFPLGLNDLVPRESNKLSGTHGGIQRPSAYTTDAVGVAIPDPSGTNHWWGSKYLQWSSSKEVNLESNMKSLYNSLHANQDPPKVIICDQADFELYEEFALDKSQVIKDEATRLVDLGFEVLRFKGKPMFWVTGIDTGDMIMLNTDWITVKYDPSMWFDMTDFKHIPLQGERIAHILCTLQMYTTQPRRHGRLHN